MANLVGQVLLKRYRVDAFVAAGGMGSVYRVWDLKRNVFLAMKVLHTELADDPTMFRRFQREARALQRLAHPNIVPFYGLHKTDELVFLLERYIDGPSVSQILKQARGKGLPLLDALAYLRALCSALGYAHANGVVHCDVKPGNVMIDRGGNIYLTDFGIARHAESTTTTLASAGTPAYMAPEQARGDPVSPATDIYALGVILFEMLTRQRPFRGSETGPISAGDSDGSSARDRIRNGHLRLAPPDPRELNPQISPALAQVVLHALVKDPANRPESARAFFEAACSAAGLTPTQIPERVALPGNASAAATRSEPFLPSVKHPQAGSAISHRVAYAFLAGATIVLVLGGVLLWGLGQASEQTATASAAEASSLGGSAVVGNMPTNTQSMPAGTPLPDMVPTFTAFPVTAAMLQAGATHIINTGTPAPPPRYDLAFASNKAGKITIYLMNSQDPQDWLELTRPPDAERIWWPTFCGEMIAAEVTFLGRASSDWIYLINPISQEAVKFSPPGNAPETVAVPRCSSDGSMLAYSANRRDAWWLMIANLVRGNKEFQLEGKNFASIGYISWTGQEEPIYWMGVSEDRRLFSIWRSTDLSSENGVTTYITTGKYPAISPNGKKLAYFCSGNLELCVIDLISGNMLFTHSIRYKRLGGEDMPASAMWSGDGAWLYYASAQDGDWDIYRISNDGKTVQNMTQDWPTDELMPALRW